MTIQEISDKIEDAKTEARVKLLWRYAKTTLTEFEFDELVELRQKIAESYYFREG